MTDTAWKSFNRFLCRLFGGTRTWVGEAGQDCQNTGMFAVEAKYRKRIPAWLEDMMLQAEDQARDDQMPLVVLTENSMDRMQALVICRLQDFYDWFVGIDEPSEEDNGPQADVESIDPSLLVEEEKE